MVGQGQNIEESISRALTLKRIGVPWVIAKAEIDIHGEILTKGGAARIVFPEAKPGTTSLTPSSSGITPALTAAGKIILCAAMLVGRLGPLTAVYARQRHQRPERYRFPEEAVRIG